MPAESMDVVANASVEGLSNLPHSNGLQASVPLRVLTVTTLFPSLVSPRHGIFVETRLRKLRETMPVDVRVVAPVPWFPVTWSIAGRYAEYAATPRREQRHGMEVRHPRFVTIPRFGMTIQPTSLAAASIRATRELMDDGWSFDVVDAHYLYPDGVAAAALARKLQRPFVVTARGSDVNLIAQMPTPRRRILEALEGASRVIAVSESLKSALVRIGLPSSSVEVLRNGVDTELFKFVERETTRKWLGIDEAPMIVSVGNLVEEKGHELVLRAARHVQEAKVIVVGQGRERPRLIALANQLEMHSRVRFIDNLTQPDLAKIYSAADVLALGSTREGWPNVLLEAMACGTPVVTTAVGSVREIVATDVVGEIVSECNELEFAAALRRVLSQQRDRKAVRMHAMKFSWDPVVRRYYEVLTTAADSRRH